MTGVGTITSRSFLQNKIRTEKNIMNERHFINVSFSCRVFVKLLLVDAFILIILTKILFWFFFVDKRICGDIFVEQLLNNKD